MSDFPEIILNLDVIMKDNPCVLANPNIAKIVQDALLYFEGERYYLIAWCIMPDHVHVLFAPKGGYTVSTILHSWKSYTANKINKILKRDGPFWSQESFDHVVRSVENLYGLKLYIEDNPVKAGLCSRDEDWAFSSSGNKFNPSSEYEFIDPRKTPFVHPQFRKLPHLYKENATYFVTFTTYFIKQ